MSVLTQAYCDILFDDSDLVCVGNTPFEIGVRPIKHIKEIEPRNFVCINPLKSSRKDDNVTKYRNILLEFDQGTVEEQRQLINDLQIPYSTIVYSGNKSLHVIISLVAPCENRQEYDALVKRIYTKVPQADQSTKNPSRFSRFPEAMRDNQKQYLIESTSRVLRAKLETWLGPEELKTEQPIVATVNQKRLIKGSTWHFLLQGAPEGSWNKTLFLAALDLLRCGFSEDEVTARLQEVTGKLDKKDKSTIKSAIQTFRKGE